MQKIDGRLSKDIEKREITIRAKVDEKIYLRVEETIKKAKAAGIKISFRDVILKGLNLKNEELGALSIACKLDKKNYDRFLELKKKTGRLLVMDVVKAGLKSSIESYKKIINNIT
jgi:hypothetical protein